MCGLAGLLDPSHSIAPEALVAQARAMAEAIAYRGPDDSGEWVDAAAGIALAHRRLAILDLSADGHQPMLSADGRFVIAFNGEIYNFAELRAELEARGAAFRGRSDTEVLVAAIAAWGCRQALGRLVGMFAFALWDKKNRVLTLARDRLGEKPLYYGWSGGKFFFGSELKALEAHPEFRGEVDRGAVALLLRYNCVPAPYSIFKNVRKLPPGTSVELGSESGGMPEPVPYWSVLETARRCDARPAGLDDTEAVDRLEELLKNAVGRQMAADVPLGAFLSGGVDSSTIVALMQAQSARPIKTFSIGFREEGYDEAGAARAVAGHLRTDHTELYVTPREALDVVPKLASIYDEPFADSSQIPTVLLARLARSQVTVSLSGDGGDEVFGGYNRYLWAPKLWAKLALVPRPARAALGAAMKALPESALVAGLAALKPVLPRASLALDKLHKTVDALDARSLGELYLALRSHWQNPAAALLGAVEPETPPVRPPSWPAAGSISMAAVDAFTYLPDDILVKVDRAAMAASLETRVPFLDPGVLELAWRLRPDQRIREGRGKWALRQVLRRHLPPALSQVVERPKMGFAAPVGRWLRGELRDWAEGLLDEKRLREGGIFDPRAVRSLWEAHVSGARDWHPQLWNALMFQAWADRQY